MPSLFKVKIAGSAKPPIWRKIKENNSMTFDDFHPVIQIDFRWINTHLYHFSPKDWGAWPKIKLNNEEFEIRVPFSKVNTFFYGKKYDVEKSY